MARFRVFFAIGLVLILTLILLPFQLLALALGVSARHSLPLFWHRFTCRMLGIHVRVHGEIAKGRPLLIAANHVSWLDIVVVGSLGQLSFIAKSDMQSWPVFGLLAKLQRTIFVEREDRRKTGDQVDEISQTAGGRRSDRAVSGRHHL